MQRSWPRTVRRTVRRVTTWRPQHAGDATLDVSDLIRPYRYDVLVRASLFDRIDVDRPMGEDLPDFAAQLRDHPYATWFREVELRRFFPWVLQDEAEVRRRFVRRVGRALAVHSWVQRHGFDAGRPLTLRRVPLPAFTDEGTFEHGASTLQLLADPVGAQAAGRWARARERLLTARAERPQPGRDDKVVTAWNGLAIAGLAEVGVLLDRRDLLEAATRCAEHLVATHLVDAGDGPRLRRSSRDGVVGAAAAVGDDHGDLAEGLLALHQATGDLRWLHAARDLVDTALARFTYPEIAVHDTADDAEALFARPHSGTDGAEPSGQSALAGAALTLGALTGEPSYLEAADRALHAAGAVATREPRFAGWALAVAEARAAGPLQVAVVTPGPHDARGRALLETVRASASPGLVLAYGAPDAPGVPLLAARPLVDGGAAAYVCRGFVCDRPVTTPEELAAALSPPSGAAGAGS